MPQIHMRTSQNVRDLPITFLNFFLFTEIPNNMTINTVSMNRKEMSCHKLKASRFLVGWVMLWIILFLFLTISRQWWLGTCFPKLLWLLSRMKGMLDMVDVNRPVLCHTYFISNLVQLTNSCDQIHENLKTEAQFLVSVLYFTFLQEELCPFSGYSFGSSVVRDYVGEICIQTESKCVFRWHLAGLGGFIYLFQLSGLEYLCQRE